MPEFTLPPLPYAYDALEPSIDALTMQIHHDKHHATYVNNLNAALKDHPDLQDKSLEYLLRRNNTLPAEIQRAVRNNAGGHHNHSLLWDIMTPDGAQSPAGALAGAIQSAFGGVEPLKTRLNVAGAKQFGSGWAWLVVNIGGDLDVVTTANQDSPLLETMTPVFGIDVWEHAYYLKYQNKRPDYLAAWWNVINWDRAEVHYRAAKTDDYSLEIVLSTL